MPPCPFRLVEKYVAKRWQHSRFTRWFLSWPSSHDNCQVYPKSHHSCVNIYIFYSFPFDWHLWILPEISMKIFVFGWKELFGCIPHWESNKEPMVSVLCPVVHKLSGSIFSFRLFFWVVVPLLAASSRFPRWSHLRLFLPLILYFEAFLFPLALLRSRGPIYPFILQNEYVFLRGYPVACLTINGFKLSA